MAELEQLLEANPGSERFAELANIYTRQGRYNDAISLCRHGLTAHPGKLEGYLALGRALFGMGRLTAATQSLRRAVQLDSNSTEAYRLLGEVLLRRKIFTEAVQLLEDAASRGVGGAKLTKLLQKATDLLESQATMIAEDPNSPKGMGNVAVAGTIGSQVGAAQGPPTEYPSEELLLQPPAQHAVADDGPGIYGAEEDLALRAFPGAAPNHQDWGDLVAAWEERLEDNSQRRLMTDPDVPVTSNSAVSVDVAPLTDPIADGIPPLPSDTHEVALPPELAPTELAIEREEDPTSPFEDGDTAVDMVAESVPRPATAAAAAAPVLSTDAGGRGSDVEEDDDDDLLDYVEPTFIGGRPPLRSLMTDSGEDDPVEQGDADLAERPRRASFTAVKRLDDLPTDSDEGQVLLTDVTSDAAMPISKSSGAGGLIGKLVLWLLVLGALGAGGFLGWQHYQAGKAAKAALKAAVKVRASLSISEIDKAAKQLLDVLRLPDPFKAVPRKRVRAERAILLLMKQHWWGVADKKGVVFAGEDWSALIAHSLRSLVHDELGRAGKMVETASRLQKGRSALFERLLQGEIALARGQFAAALTVADELLAKQKDFAAGLYLRARSLRARGNVAGAAKAYADLSAKVADFELAKVGRWAVSLRQGDTSAKAPQVSSPHGKREAALLEGWQTALKQGSHEKLVKATALKNMTTTSLLADGAYALAVFCELERSAKLEKRLSRMGGAKDSGIADLRAELALLRGEPINIRLLPKKETGKAAVLRAWQRLLWGDRQAKTAQNALQKATVAAIAKLTKAHRRRRRRPAKVDVKAMLAGKGRLVPLAESLVAASVAKSRFGAAQSPAPAAALLQKPLWAQRYQRALQAEVALAGADAMSAAKLLLGLDKSVSPKAVSAKARRARKCAGYPAAWRARGRLAMEMGDYRKAASWFSKAHRAGAVRRANQHDVSAEAEFGLALVLSGRLTRAVSVINAVLKHKRDHRGLLRPARAALRLARAALLLAQGKPEDVQKLLRKDTSAWGQLLLERSLQADESKARQRKSLLRAVLGKRPQFIEARIRLAELLAEEGAPAPDAKAEADKIIDSAKKGLPVAPAMLARAHICLANATTGDTAPHYREAIKADPSHCGAKHALGAVLIKKKRTRKEGCLVLGTPACLEQADADDSFAFLRRCRPEPATRRAWAKHFLSLESKGRRARRARRWAR
jgi:tetratricopeptide (TPR) repeat protein